MEIIVFYYRYIAQEFVRIILLLLLYIIGNFIFVDKNLHSNLPDISVKKIHVDPLLRFEVKEGQTITPLHS